jgi:hypothetical protein
MSLNWASSLIALLVGGNAVYQFSVGFYTRENFVLFWRHGRSDLAARSRLPLCAGRTLMGDRRL